MTTPITFSSIARLAAPVLVAGALAAGCGTVAANPGGPNKPAADLPAVSASGSASGSHSVPPSGAPTPVPTVSGGPAVLVGEAACSGWPADAPHGTLTVMFAPVAVERCVTSFQEITGKGEWETATLERSTDRLATLSAVLMEPSVGHQPDVMCPEFVILPPQIVLFNSVGKELIPRLPVGPCGGVDTRVMSTLAAMTWQPVSVRLVAQISPVVAPTTLPGASLAPGSPKVLRTGAVSGVANGTPQQ